MEVLEPYYHRFRKRFFKDATPWARDNIVWGGIVVVVPPLAAYLRDRSAPMDWILIKNSLILYAFALGVYGLAYLRLTAKSLDDDRETRERALIATIAERGQVVIQREDEIRALRQKPKRSAAEQHDYEKAKKLMSEIYKEKGIIALRHLRGQGEITFPSPGFGVNPPAPSGITVSEMRWVYGGCAAESVITMKRNFPNTDETFSMTPTQQRALDDVLFEG